ncbi:MAG: ABC transporter permease [Polyangiaceae bacterium]|nr:ABC transporter permease [Polyangiaceae bacterium]
MILATLLMAVRAILRNLMRSFLTMLGVVIGVGAVVALVSIAQGATESVTASIASMGSNMLTVSPGAARRGGMRTPSVPFKMEDVAAIQRDIRGLAAIAPSGSRSVMLVYGNKNWRASVTGSTEDYIRVRNYSIATGREMTSSDVRSASTVCMIGATTKKELFGSQDAIGQEIRVDNKVTCEIIGIFKPKGEGGMGQDQDDLVVMPLGAFQKRIVGNRDVSSIFVSVEDGRPSSLVKDQITALMRERRRIGRGAEDDFNVRDITELMATIEESSKMMTMLLSAITGVSLIVGGIGIMNIMLVSVTERTREIGTRLAIGATGWEVLFQFLVEAVMLSTLGGCIGVILGVGGAAIASKFLSMPFVIVPWIIVVAFISSAVIGVVTGFLPARKAANLNPIEALRHE